MKRYYCIAGFILVTLGSGVSQYTFTNEPAANCTAVEDQQSTNTCWSFATTSFIESELIRATKPAVDLSEMYIVRQIYLDKARNYLLRQGKANFAEGGLSHDVIHAISTYGAMPESAYPGRAFDQERLDHHELIVVLKSVLDGMLNKKAVSDKWPEVVNAILDVYLGPLPETFQVGNKTYTARSFARDLNLELADYVSITSFTHHPFYETFVLEIPDNHANGSYYNVPIADLERITKNALANGHTIAWDGDVSEHGFGAQHGIAVLPGTSREDFFMQPGPEMDVTQEDRQKAFELFATTDDHLMHITGTAQDRQGNNYLIVKNSWGEIGPYNGFLYMSPAYFKAKTIAIMVHLDAIPADIAARMAL